MKAIYCLGLNSPGLRSLGLKSSWLKSLGLKSSWLKSLGLKGLGLKLGVKKSGVEMSFNPAYDIMPESMHVPTPLLMVTRIFFPIALANEVYIY